MTIDLDKTIFYLFCAFALLLPLEHILEVFFGIETILKPYRVANILIIIVFGIKLATGNVKEWNYWSDLPFYGIFLYGILITFFRMPDYGFSQRLFNNDIFQISLYLLVYFILKHINLNRQQWTHIFYSLTIGISLNAFYLFNAFFFNADYSRQGGFMNNPNYVALSITVAVAFLVYRLSISSSRFEKIFCITNLLFLLFVFPITGSRTGLAILFVIAILIFIFATWRTKIITVLAVSAMTFFFIGKNLDNFNIGASFVLTNRVSKKIDKQDVRVPIWEGAIAAGNEVYFTGLGIGQFKAKFPRIFQSEYHKTILEFVNRGTYMSVHSDYVGLLVIYGFVSLILYLFFLANTSLSLLKNIFRKTNKIHARFYQLNLMILAAIAIFGIGSENFLSPLYWAFLGLCTVSLSIPNEPHLGDETE